MKPLSKPSKRAAWVAAFAIAMAWMESATVVYLRLLVNRLDPYQKPPLPVTVMDSLGPTELIREAATILMIWAVAWLAGTSRRNRFGYFMIAFGLWDVFYYLFLSLICGWPKSLWDWDILFLLPLPWWGPVLSPMLIAVLLVLTGLLLSLYDTDQAPLWPRRLPSIAGGIGTTIALYVFMEEAIPVATKGAEALRQVLPEHFDWPWFLFALALMTVPLADMVWQIGSKNRSSDPK